METTNTSFFETLIKIKFQKKSDYNSRNNFKIVMTIDEKSFVVATQVPEDLLLQLEKKFDVKRIKEEDISWKEMWILKSRRKN